MLKVQSLIYYFIDNIDYLTTMAFEGGMSRSLKN